MGRQPRIVAPGCAHHVTQWGVDRQRVFFSNEDCQFYLQLLRRYGPLHDLDVIGYCLMTNHVHLVVVPKRTESMARTLARVHGEYAQRINWLRERTGHLWENRFYSCPMDENHLWSALRYVERNPVEAQMVEAPWHWEWSSAGVHLGCVQHSAVPLATEWWRARFSEDDWREYLLDESDRDDSELRQATRNGWALGGEEFLLDLERRLGRRVRPNKGGRPRKSPAPESAQEKLFAVAKAR